MALENQSGEFCFIPRPSLLMSAYISSNYANVNYVCVLFFCAQILATTSLGACHVLYSPSKSINGALLPLAKQVRAKPRQEAYIANAPQVIITPHALPMFQEESYYQSKKSQEKARNDPVKSHKPQEPVVGKGSGGRIGASAQQHIVQNMFRNTMMDEDPREALLKYAQKEGEEAMYTSGESTNFFFPYQGAGIYCV